MNMMNSNTPNTSPVSVEFTPFFNACVAHDFFGIENELNVTLVAGNKRHCYHAPLVYI